MRFETMEKASLQEFIDYIDSVFGDWGRFICGEKGNQV